MDSILFSTGAGASAMTVQQPLCFPDLNLDQVVDMATAGKSEYDLKPFFCTLLPDTDAVLYRHEVFQDLEKEFLSDSIKTFAARTGAMRKRLAFAEKLGYRYERARWVLEAVDLYCDAVSALTDELTRAEIDSRGFSTLRDHMIRYTQAESFRSLQTEARKLKEDLASLRYCLLIEGTVVKVRRYDSEKDYASEVEKAFAKFRQGSQKKYLAEFRSSDRLNHVEAMALDCVARLFPEVFSRLDEFCDRNREFADATILTFDREVQFYVSYLEFTAPLRRAGLRFCYPDLSETRKGIVSRRGYDLALASKLVGENATVVCNDFSLNGAERVLVVTGPNQGGKTTFARTFGQLHFLAALGCPVPGTEARLLLADAVFTHFEKQESIAELRGKLEDDLLRIHSILRQSTSRSVIVMNEIFTSTTVQDALFLSRRILERVFDKEVLAVLVTFLDELAAPHRHTVSMAATVDPHNPLIRTFKIMRAPADGLAYALTLAARHRLGYESIRERVRT